MRGRNAPQGWRGSTSVTCPRRERAGPAAASARGVRLAGARARRTRSSKPWRGPKRITKGLHRPAREPRPQGTHGPQGQQQDEHGQQAGRDDQSGQHEDRSAGGRRRSRASWSHVRAKGKPGRRPGFSRRPRSGRCRLAPHAFALAEVEDARLAHRIDLHRDRALGREAALEDQLATAGSRSAAGSRASAAARRTPGRSRPWRAPPAPRRRHLELACPSSRAAAPAPAAGSSRSPRCCFASSAWNTTDLVDAVQELGPEVVLHLVPHRVLDRPRTACPPSAWIIVRAEVARSSRSPCS